MLNVEAKPEDYRNEYLVLLLFAFGIIVSYINLSYCSLLDVAG